MRPEIWVMGSAICDLVFSVDYLPAQGETVLGRGFSRFPGGKGANQAVAAAKLGGTVHFVGKIGRDPFGDELKQSLLTAGVRLDGLAIGDSDTGCASILLDSNGQNQIVVNPGANHDLTAREVVIAFNEANEGDFVLLQQEMTTGCNLAAAREGLKIILNPAPALPIPPALLKKLYALTPNESEALLLTGFDPIDTETCRGAGAKLLDLGVQHVVITLGERGCYYTDGKSEIFEPAPEVKAIDTVGAGDAFNGALAVALSNGELWDKALRFANAAAAISVTRQGAQTSMPTLDELNAVLG